MGVNITTIVYLRVLIIEIGSTIVLMVVEAQGIYIYTLKYLPPLRENESDKAQTLKDCADSNICLQATWLQVSNGSYANIHEQKFFASIEQQ